MVGKKYFKKSNPAVIVKVVSVENEIVNFHQVGYFNWVQTSVEQFNNTYTEVAGQPIKNESAIRNQLKAALENMYMFGGMPKPDPNYERYLNNMIECVMSEVKKSA